MKRSIFKAALGLLGICLLTLSACDKEEDQPVAAQPVITLEEVGEADSRTVTAGSDLHLEGELSADGLIGRIDLEIHQEEGTFKIEKAFTEGKYIGVKNVLFHEHVDIPAEAPAGAYHLHLTVTDRTGQQQTAEAELTIIGK